MSVTLCAIMKDERPYLAEWVAHHRLLGFDRIVIYSNDCSDGTELDLDRLADLGLLEHRPWPSGTRTSPQISAYADAVGRCTTTWIGFLDADEFFNPRIDESIGAFLQRFDADVSAVAVNWRIFGSSGQRSQTAQPVTARFTRASVSTHHRNRHCKTFARAADIEEPLIHRCFLTRGRYVDSHGQDVQIERLGFTPSVQHDVAQINHYVVKSSDEFADKQRRGNANRRTDSPDKYTGRTGSFFSDHDLNDQIDLSILRFSPRLHAEMELLSDPNAI